MFRNAFQRLDPRVPTINRRLFFFFLLGFFCNPGGLNLLARWGNGTF